MNRPDDRLLTYYDSQLERHGDNAQGAAWPNEADRQRRFEVLTDVLRADMGSPLVCDLGCGTGELLRFLREQGRGDIGYIGVDRSELALSHARNKFPDARWIGLDVLSASEAELDVLECDHLVANGLFTVRHDLSHEAMWEFLGAVLARLWPRVRRSLAFNVMSPVVDWERDDLFHASHDRMARLLHGLAGRHVQMRADYGLYEYTCIALRRAPALPVSAASTMSTSVPAYRPRLPDSGQVLPYLRRIDASRIYSNHGPLVGELEARLAARLRLEQGRVICAGSGTAALVGAILATAGRATEERPYALCPAYTFVGTAVALQQCGYVPWLVDVESRAWQMQPSALLAHPALPRCGVVLPVAPYGRMPPLGEWARFRRRTGVPVVVDGAAAIEALLAAPEALAEGVPVALSFHATKALPTGEGGAVVTSDDALGLAAFRALNFGFFMTRESRGPSINGKMPEHAAALGLAGLDTWEDHHVAVQSVAAAYREAFAAAGLGERLHTAPDIASHYAIFDAPSASSSARVAAALAGAGYESRFWYGRGLQAQPALAGVPADELKVTEAIAPRLLGLPVAPDLDPAAIRRVADIVRDAHVHRPDEERGDA